MDDYMAMYLKMGQKEEALVNNLTLMYKPSLSIMQAFEQGSKDCKEFLEVKL